MSVKPFNWTNLKKVTSEDVRLVESAYEFIPDTSVRDVLGMNIRKMLVKHLGEKSFYYLDSVKSEPYNQFIGSLSESAVLAVIGTNTGDAKLVMHIDRNLVFLLIDRLLGGTQEPNVENRPLTETEQGVLQYFVMQALATMWRSCGEAERFHFRFERFAFSASDIENTASKKDVAVSFNFKVGIGELAGFVNLVFTKAFIEKTASLAVTGSKFELKHFENKMGRYGYIRTSIWAEAGKASISTGDLIALEAGDVVIFDESGLTLKNGVPTGEVDLRVGKGDEGGLRAEISPEREIIKCTIVGG